MSKLHMIDKSNINELKKDLQFERDKEYLNFFNDLKKQIQQARLRAASVLNSEVIHFYWSIGKHIIEQQKKASWGDKFLECLSNDLSHSFPEMRGFSKTNLKYMRIFAHYYPDGIGQQPVDQLPWGHVTLLIRIKNQEERHWYAKECNESGWSRPTLEKQILSGLYQRQAIIENKASNYLTRLPEPQSALAHDMLKNPYNFDFLGLHDDALEREIEHASVQHITKFLLELGRGFAFVGTQVPVVVSEQEYFIDALFYNLRLHAYLVVEFKSTAFKPEHAGQLNFYLSAVDEQIKTDLDAPTIGLILCKSRDKIIAEYALRGIQNPIGISEYSLTKSVPEQLKVSLPSIREIEEEFNNNN